VETLRVSDNRGFRPSYLSRINDAAGLNLEPASRFIENDPIRLAPQWRYHPFHRQGVFRIND
jgi:hypothetical protein